MPDHLNRTTPHHTHTHTHTHNTYYTPPVRLSTLLLLFLNFRYSPFGRPRNQMLIYHIHTYTPTHLHTYTSHTHTHTHIYIYIYIHLCIYTPDLFPDGILPNQAFRRLCGHHETHTRTDQTGRAPRNRGKSQSQTKPAPSHPTLPSLDSGDGKKKKKRTTAQFVRTCLPTYLPASPPGAGVLVKTTTQIAPPPSYRYSKYIDAGYVFFDDHPWHGMQQHLGLAVTSRLTSWTGSLTT